VEYAGPLKGWGGVVILRLGGGYHVALAGLDAMSAPMGQAIQAGQTVGRMSPAASPAPELYLEVRKDETPVDPSRWLRPSQVAQAR
jgi:septal ring factor EnvC (AmiA/AmiB activator)